MFWFCTVIGWNTPGVLSVREVFLWPRWNLVRASGILYGGNGPAFGSRECIDFDLRTITNYYHQICACIPPVWPFLREIAANMTSLLSSKSLASNMLARATEPLSAVQETEGQNTSRELDQISRDPENERLE
jgi:hypothetical protein